MESLKEKIKYKIKSRKTYSRKFKYFWDNPSKIKVLKRTEKIYLLDAKFIQGRKYSVHVCSKLPESDFVIIDGHSGILSVVKHFWPSTELQRCILYIS